MSEDKQHNQPQQHFPSSHGILNSPKSVIIIYTVFRILFEIRKFLGLEAMLEYIGNHIENLEKINPQMKHAVTRALFFMDVRKIYEEARLTKK